MEYSYDYLGHYFAFSSDGKTMGAGAYGSVENGINSGYMRVHAHNG